MGLCCATRVPGVLTQTLKSSLSQDPTNAETLNYLAYLYAEEGINLEESLEMAVKAVELEPTNGAYQDTLGWIYFKLNRLDDAQTTLERAVTLVADDPVIQEHMGEVYSRKKLYDKARAAWQKVLELDPNSRVKLKLQGLPPK